MWPEARARGTHEDQGRTARSPDLDETLSRSEFQRITADLLDRTRAPFNVEIEILVELTSRLDTVGDLYRANPPSIVRKHHEHEPAGA